jgi:PAS domain S-box-containing protein
MPASSKGVRDALLDSEERYRSLFEEAPVAYHEIDREGILLRVNRAECELLGFEAAHMVGRHVREFVAPEERETSRQAIREKIAGLRPLSVFERDYVRRDGGVRVLEIHENFIRDRQGAVVGIRSALLDITDRKRASEELHRYAEELERKNEALALASVQEATELKTRFLSNVSHEIRTPLNGVLGMADLLLGTRLSREQRSFAEALHSSAETLLAVINGLLDFSKLASGRLELETVSFDPTQVLEDVASSLAARAQEKELELTCLVPPGMPRLLRGDRRRLRQVVTHLVSKAVKFTERGEVSLRAEVRYQTDERAVIRVTVADTGIGIAPEMPARIFAARSASLDRGRQRHQPRDLAAIPRNGRLRGDRGDSPPLGAGRLPAHCRHDRQRAGRRSGPLPGGRHGRLYRRTDPARRVAGHRGTVDPAGGSSARGSGCRPGGSPAPAKANTVHLRWLGTTTWRRHRRKPPMETLLPAAPRLISAFPGVGGSADAADGESAPHRKPRQPAPPQQDPGIVVCWWCTS